jgi:GNAT superfamily N-acetyltransferase
MAVEWQMRIGTAGDLDLVEPLWVAVHHRHAEVMPELAPYVSDGQTWSVRRAQYRDSGLGSHLLDRLETHLHDSGVDDLILGVLPGNRDAIRLYERRSYQPTWLYLSRFKGRTPPR